MRSKDTTPAQRWVLALTSAACALAPDATALIAARAVPGAGAALMLPLALALLSAARSPRAWTGRGCSGSTSPSALSCSP